MGREIDLELRFAAEESYITGSLAFEQLALSTGISATQLRRWAEAEGWREKRSEYRKKFADIRLSTVRLRRKIIKNALTSLNPMDTFAVVALEKLALSAEKAAGAGMPAAVIDSEGSAAEAPEIKTPADAVAALKAVVEKRLQRMLMQPDSINLAAVKDVKQALELIEKMQAEIAPAEAGDTSRKILSQDAIKDIREQLKL